MHVHFPFSYTLIRSLLTTLDLHVQILDVSYYWSGVRWDWACCEKLEFLSTYSGIFVFLFYSSDSVVFLTPTHYYQSLFLFYIHCYLVWTFICVLQWSWFITVSFIACSGYFRLSIYTWGILLAYIRRRLPSRLHFHVF